MIPADLRAELEWRLVQGGMAELFRVGVLTCVELIYAAGFKKGCAVGREQARSEYGAPRAVSG